MKWKIGFWLYSIISTLGVFALFRITPIEYLVHVSIITAITIVALHRYAFHKDYGSEKLWKIIFWFQIIDTILGIVYYFFQTLPLHTVFHYKFPYSVPEWYTIICDIVVLPIYYVYFLLAYRYKKVAEANKLARLKKAEKKEKVDKRSRSKLAVFSAIVAAVNLLFFNPILFIVSFLLSILSLVNIKKEHQKGKYFALAALAFSSLFLLLYLAGIIFGIYQVRNRSALKVAQGGDAIQQLTQEEVIFINNKLVPLTQESTVEDLKKALGEPKNEKHMVLFSRYYFTCPTPTPTCSIVADYIVNELFSIDYLDTARLNYVLNYGLGQKILPIQFTEATESGRFGENLASITAYFQKVQTEKKLDTKKELLYAYYFADPDVDKLKPVKDELTKQGLVFVSSFKSDDGTVYVLEVMEKAIHTPESLLQRNRGWNDLAQKEGIKEYGGFEILPLNK